MLNFKSRGARLIKKAVVSAVTAAAIMIGTVASAGVLKPAFADNEYTADVREAEMDKLNGKTVLLHTGDAGGAIDGYARLSALKNELESSGAEVIMADTGNYTQEGTGDDRFRTVDALMLMTSMGYNVATIGNAELANGYAPFRNDISGAKFRLVCANVYKDDKTILTPGYLHNTGSGLKIGFFGLSDPGETEGVTVRSGDEMYDCVADQVESLKKSGADLIIGLTHIGMDNAEKLYNNVEDIDLIIAGNTNVAGTQGARGEPVQSAGARFAYIGAVVIDKEGNVTDHYLISTEGLDTDPALQKTVDRIKERLGSNVDVASENGIAKIISEYSDEKASAETASDADKSQTKTGTDDKSGADKAEEKTEADDKASDASAAEGKEEGLSLNSDGKYEVVKGDCLWKIAEKHLGDGSRWGEIYELNSNIISNPSLIYIGQQLVLPPG